jgi:catechol 2,3-dioxygenase-like lactoylglutathione lyase family enzyme
MPIKMAGHVGICVSDLDRALRFWCDGLGFELLRGSPFYGSSWKRVMEIEGDLYLQTKMIRRDHLKLEILYFEKPGHIGTTARRPMNQLGFTHLAVWVEDIEAVARRVVEYGGSIIESTRTIFNHPKLHGKWIICTDPDGILVELVEYPEGESVLEHLKSLKRPG